MADVDQFSRADVAAGLSAPADVGLTNPLPPSETSVGGSPAAPRPRRRRIAGALLRSLIAVLVGSLILRLASHAMGQMTQFYLDHISDHYYHISYTMRGYVIASFFVTELLGSLVLGAMSDRYGRRFFIMLGPLLGAVAVQVTAMTSVLWVLVFARLLAGLSTGSSVPATLGYISEATVGRPYLRARIVGLFEITLVGGFAIGAFVAGYLWTFFGTTGTFAGIGLLSPAFSIDGLIFLTALAIFAWGFKDKKRKSTSSPQSLPSHSAIARRKLAHYYRVFKSPSVRMFSPAWISIFSIVGVWTNHSVGLFAGKEHLHAQLLMGSITPERFGNGSATLLAFFAMGVLAWSFVLARFRKTSVMLASTFALFALLLTVFGLNHVGTSSAFFYLLLGSLLIEVLVLSGFTPAALTYLADVTENYAADRGSIMGLYSVFLGIGQLVGTSVGGYFADWNGVDGLLMLSAILGGITVFSLLTLRRQETAVARPPVIRDGE